jgi:hypothetical protein
MRDQGRQRGMARSTRLARTVVVLVGALLTGGCGSTASTQEAPDEAPSSTPFSVYTHCGVENVRIDGRWWHAKPPLYNNEQTGPPAGWGDPHQEGTLTVEFPDRAVFEALGQRVVFVPAPDNEPVRVCR